MNDVNSITYLTETYSKQPQYLRAYILIYLIMRLCLTVMYDFLNQFPVI
jgi:hypothetical protein